MSEIFLIETIALCEMGNWPSGFTFECIPKAGNNRNKKLSKNEEEYILLLLLFSWKRLYILTIVELKHGVLGLENDFLYKAQ